MKHSLVNFRHVASHERRVLTLDETEPRVFIQWLVNGLLVKDESMLRQKELVIFLLSNMYVSLLSLDLGNSINNPHRWVN